jgi:hypothetical protein
MQAPVQLDSVNVSTERVRQLYEAMPAVFARDIARAKGQPIPPQPTPTLKRERPGDESDVIMKRRDTGESKIGMGMPPPATPSLPPKSISAPVQPFTGVAHKGRHLIARGCYRCANNSRHNFSHNRLRCSNRRCQRDSKYPHPLVQVQVLPLEPVSGAVRVKTKHLLCTRVSCNRLLALMGHRG